MSFESRYGIYFEFLSARLRITFIRLSYGLMVNPYVDASMCAPSDACEYVLKSTARTHRWISGIDLRSGELEAH